MQSDKLINTVLADDTQEIPVNYENAICLLIVSELIFTASQRTIETIAYQLANQHRLPIAITLKINQPSWLIDELAELAQELGLKSESMLETLQQQETTDEIS